MSAEVVNNVPVNAPALSETDYAELWLKQHYDPEEKTFTIVEQSVTGRDGSGNQSFQWGVGPLQVKGTINTSTFSVSFQAGVQVPFFGFVSLGSIGGNLKDGVSLGINVFVAKGSVRVYLKNSNELWVGVSLSSPVFSAISGDWKILSFCEWGSDEDWSVE